MEADTQNKRDPNFREKDSITINYRNCATPGLCYGTDCDDDHCRCHDDCAHNN